MRWSLLIVIVAIAGSACGERESRDRTAAVPTGGADEARNHAAHVATLTAEVARRAADFERLAADSVLAGAEVSLAYAKVVEVSTDPVDRAQLGRASRDVNADITQVRALTTSAPSLGARLRAAVMLSRLQAAATSLSRRGE